MPLTKEEREFLDAYVYEATHEPFGGPATEDLRRRGVYYADLHGVLTSYHRELSSERTLPFGKQNPSPPPSPWTNREDIELRNRALLQEQACQKPIAADATENPGAPALQQR
jgi:hypothetical protein